MCILLVPLCVCGEVISVAERLIRFLLPALLIKLSISFRNDAHRSPSFSLDRIDELEIAARPNQDETHRNRFRGRV